MNINILFQQVNKILLIHFQFEMKQSLSHTHSLLYLFILFLLTIVVKGGINNLVVSPLTINSIATYTWSITLDIISTPLTLTFPTQVNILSNRTVTVNGLTANFTQSSNIITISSGIASTSLSVIVSNVQNPSSAISSFSFSYSTPAEITTSLKIVSQIQYQTGTFSSCLWSFSLCTQQSESDLMISFTTVNKLFSGINYFLVGYTSIWPNSQSKGLLTGVSGLTCTYSTNNSNFMPVTSCTIDSTRNRILVLFSTIPDIGGGTDIVIKISGVVSPPTKTITTSTNYYVFTAVTTQIQIDGLSSCAFSNVCVTNQTNGAFSPTPSMRVNNNIGNPNLLFTTTPLNITIQPSDSIDIYYSPIASLMSCNTFSFYRSGTIVYSASSPTTSSNYISFSLSNSMSPNTDYTFPFNLYLSCSSFLLPPSETSTNFSFIFKRSSSQYLQLNTTVTASANTFNSSRATLSLSSPSMLSVSNFTFNFLISQPLGANPALKLFFPVDFIIGTPLCSASIISITVNSANCSASSNTITIVLTLSSSLPTNSNITVFIQGITNPSSPITYLIGMDTFHDSTVNTSRVETSSTAFSATIAEISNYPVVLSPSSLTVYSQISIVLNFTSTIPIPADSTFYIQFPSGVSSISPNTNLFYVNGSPQLSTNVTTNNLTNSVTFISGSAVTAGNSVSITIPLTTPSNIGTYSFVRIIISNNSTNYISSRNSLFLNVDSVSRMTATISPVISIAGSVSQYTLTLYLTVPHSTSFVVGVDVPSDTKFITTNASCSNCSSSISPKNSTSFEFTASNPGGTASTSITLTLRYFINPRNVGLSLAWGISTKTATSFNLISYQTAYALINFPNTLTAVLQTSDPYYRNNTSPVKITFSFSNTLTAGDYIQLSPTSDIYSPVSSTSVKCSSIYGSCSLVSSSNVTVIRITPDVTTIINNTYFVILQGLISGASSSYSFTYNIAVTSMTLNSSLMDSGTMVYNVSCSENSTTNNCKRCYGNGNCIDCYLSIGQYLLGNICVNACGSSTSFFSYASSSTGKCTICINNCATCESQTHCRGCIDNYYLYPDNTCKITCQTTLGYYIGGTSPSSLKCHGCITNCLECANGSNSCTRCNNQTLLISGSCLGTCGGTNFYQLNGQCLECDESCYNCSGPGAGSCYMCSADYHKYRNTLCVSQCFNGTAVNPLTGDCGCDSQCLTCSSYTTCTACSNISQWVYNGVCVSSCPLGTYENLGQCSSCTSSCLNCTSSGCILCSNSTYIFNSICYSDCNLISLQYDNSGSTCILCPSGCDRCSTTTCNACLSDYTMSNGQCVKACLISNTCDLTTQVLPLPGFIALALWLGISIIIHFAYHKNYLPYSIILLSGIIQMVLTIGLLSSLGSSARLLATSTEYIDKMKGLLATAIVLNYLQNITYIILFIYYIKPLITNARQIDVISNVVVLAIALLTNFRFGLIAFSRMFPKPNIYVQNASKLTPIHYLCIISIFLDIISVVACGIGLLNAQKLSNTFMFSIDLLILILVNWAVTIIFVSTNKPEQYYDQFVKKYHIEQNINQTDETLANQKNVSKAKMTGHQSFNFDQFSNIENDQASYKKLNRQDKFNRQQAKLNRQENRMKNQNNQSTQNLQQNVYPVTIKSRKNQVDDPDPFIDPNFQTNLKSKKSGRGRDSIIASKVDFNKSFNKSGKSMDDSLSTKKNQKISNNLNKEILKSERKKIEPTKNIVQVSQSEYPDPDEISNKQPNNVFNAKKLNKPKRIKQNKTTIKNTQEPLKIMKKGDKIGYFQSDAYQSNIDGEDLQQIIKQKIFQSTSKIQKRSTQSFKDSSLQTEHEQISPSWFNIQNQRLDITDLQQSDPQQ